MYISQLIEHAKSHLFSYDSVNSYESPLPAKYMAIVLGLYSQTDHSKKNDCIHLYNRWDPLIRSFIWRTGL